MPEPAKAEIEPFDTVMSDAAKSVVTSDDVNVNESEASDDNPPSATSEAVMVIVGEVTSAEKTSLKQRTEKPFRLSADSRKTKG